MLSWIPGMTTWGMLARQKRNNASSLGNLFPKFRRKILPSSSRVGPRLYYPATRSHSPEALRSCKIWRLSSDVSNVHSAFIFQGVYVRQPVNQWRSFISQKNEVLDHTAVKTSGLVSSYNVRNYKQLDKQVQLCTPYKFIYSNTHRWQCD
jgi:hypothetical protein